MKCFRLIKNYAELTTEKYNVVYKQHLIYCCDSIGLENSDGNTKRSINLHMRFEVIMAMNMKIMVFHNLSPC